MNMAYNLYQDQDLEFDSRFQPAAKEKLTSRAYRPAFRSRKAPVSVNGIHRRRKKKFSW